MCKRTIAFLFTFVPKKKSNEKKQGKNKQGKKFERLDRGRRIELKRATRPPPSPLPTTATGTKKNTARNQNTHKPTATFSPPGITPHTAQEHIEKDFKHRQQQKISNRRPITTYHLTTKSFHHPHQQSQQYASSVVVIPHSFPPPFFLRHGRNTSHA